MADLELKNRSGAVLNARVEGVSDGIIVHSRSGKSRNRDYREALELVLQLLDDAKISYEVYLDSGPVQHLPLQERRLRFDSHAPVSMRFDQLVRSMNAGSSSHGAWRRLLIKPIQLNGASLSAVLSAKVEKRQVERLPASLLRLVTEAHIHRAVAKLLGGEDARNFAASRDYDALTDDGTPLSPKKIFGLALEEALGFETYPGHFSAGWGQICFELLEAAGLWIIPKSGVDPRPRVKLTQKEKEVIASINVTDEERLWIEGNPRIVTHLRRERQHGLAQQKRADFIAKHGRLFCEDCELDPADKYGTEAGDACIEVHHNRVHVAEMQPGHRSLLEDLKCLCANCHRVLHRKLALGLGVKL